VQTAPCYVPSFWHNTGVWRTDRRTDRRNCRSLYSVCKAARCKKSDNFGKSSKFPGIPAGNFKDRRFPGNSLEFQNGNSRWPCSGIIQNLILEAINTNYSIIRFTTIPENILFLISARIVNIWNSLSNFVVEDDTVCPFKARLDKFWMHQDVIMILRPTWPESATDQYVTYHVAYHVRPHQPIIDHLGLRGLVHKEAHPVIPDLY